MRSCTTACWTQVCLSYKNPSVRRNCWREFERCSIRTPLRHRLRTNADDRLPLDPRSRVEGGDGNVEGRDIADVRPQSSVPDTLEDLAQLGTIGLDDEVDRQTVGGPCLGRPDDGHQR